MDEMIGLVEMMALKFLYKEKLEKAERERQMADNRKAKVIYGSNVAGHKKSKKKTEQRSRV
ncbi:MAG: hypothetical protein ACK4E2_02515 [Pseudothermotoga sp.]